MIQTVYLDAGAYQLSFLAAQRAIYQAHYQEVVVVIDGSILFNGAQPDIIDPVNTLYGSYSSSTFTITPATAGIHTIGFLGVNPLGGDNTAFIDQVTLTANAINDGSFETPALAAATYATGSAASSSAWQFSGTAGVSGNVNRTYTFGNPNAPNGTQVAFIQRSGSMSQSAYLNTGTYFISFLAAQHANGQTQSEQIEVLLDGTQVIGLITPLGISYNLYETSTFTVTAGTHSIQFIGTSAQGGNNTALIDEVALTAAEDEISDGGFETPVLAANTYQVAPAATPWQFSGTAGIARDGSGISGGNPSAPQGAQVGFIMNNSSMSQTIYLDANTYNISLLAAQRVTGQSQSQQIAVLLDPGQPDVQVIGLITPAVTTASSIVTNINNAYTLYETSNFTVAAGVHTIQFIGLTAGSGTSSSTALLDNVTLTAAENSFSDGSFEAPVLPAYGYAIDPNGSAWQFSGLAGVTTDLSAFTTASAYAPDGAQAAFIKNNGSMSQSVWFDAGSYSISFMATQRIGFQPQQIEVLLDGVQVLLPPTTPAVATNPNLGPANVKYYVYTPYQTSNFTIATGGMHTVEFLGLTSASGDCTAFIDDVSIYAGCAISNGSFEEPALAAKAFEIAPSDPSWQFSGLAGVSSNASALTFGNPVAPDGYQVAFIKDGGSMSQSVYLAAGVYNISFMAAQRCKDQSQGQTIEIIVDGKYEGIAYPSAPASGNGWYPTGTTFGSYSSLNFTVAAGVHTILFVGLSPPTADSTAFIDDVQLNA